MEHPASALFRPASVSPLRPFPALKRDNHLFIILHFRPFGKSFLLSAGFSPLIFPDSPIQLFFFLAFGRGLGTAVLRKKPRRGGAFEREPDLRGSRRQDLPAPVPAKAGTGSLSPNPSGRDAFRSGLLPAVCRRSRKPSGEPSGEGRPIPRFGRGGTVDFAELGEAVRRGPSGTGRRRRWTRWPAVPGRKRRNPGRTSGRRRAGFRRRPAGR